MVRKIIRFIDNMIDKTVFLVCLVLFLLGSYGLYDSYMVYQQATDDSILKYKPGYETDDATNKKIKENIAIICLLYIVGVISGIVLEFLKFTV